MLLNKLVFKNFGPFPALGGGPTSKPEDSYHTLEIEDDVTVLTGANDTGKSCLLNLIRRSCGLLLPDQAIQQDEVNEDHFGASQEPKWENDRELTCEIFGKLTDYSAAHIGGMPLVKGDEIRALQELAPSLRRFAKPQHRKAGSTDWKGGGFTITSMPVVIRLPLEDGVRHLLDLERLNTAEKTFLQAGFGTEFIFAKYASMPDGTFLNHLGKAKGKLNDALRKLLPSDYRMEVILTPGKERKQLHIGLSDKHNGHVSLTLRGSGIQRLISLLGSLLAHPFNNGHYIILIDEPENSLHADAQHTLRRVLEGIASRPNMQVVYATHSPSMINTMRPSSIRVLERSSLGDIATSQILRNASYDNYSLVRSSLGLVAGDSLLFAPITIVVEGPTEVLCLPVALEKLSKAAVEGFADVSMLLSECHFLVGGGSSFPFLCRLALSHGTKPILFLDGDMRSRVSGIENVGKVLFDGITEFDQIVPLESYIEAIKLVVGEFRNDLDGLTVEAYETWKTAANLPEQMAFTKKIDRWLLDTWNTSLDKPEVMQKALSLVEADQIIAVGTLQTLVVEIRNALLGTNTGAT